MNEYRFENVIHTPATLPACEKMSGNVTGRKCKLHFVYTHTHLEHINNKIHPIHSRVF